MTQQVTRVETNDFPEVATGGGMIEVAQSRASQEVQAAMIIAQKFPRDQNKSFARIMAACKRKSLAERACYAYPKGGQSVSGPSIRLAETLAREWGNIDFGIVELEQKADESIVMSYAWDLETNTRATKIFTVKHLRHTKKGSYAIEDPREIYEMTANQGARRLRACILAVIPGDITEAAVDTCDKTLEGATTEPLADRIRNLLSAFVDMGVSQEMVERRLGHKMAATTYQEFANLYKVYVSIKDGFAGRDDYFSADVDADAPPKMNLRQQATAGKEGIGKEAPGGSNLPSPGKGATTPHSSPSSPNQTAGTPPVQQAAGAAPSGRPGPFPACKCGLILVQGVCPEHGPQDQTPGGAGGSKAPTSATAPTDATAPAKEAQEPAPEQDPRSDIDIADEFASNLTEDEVNEYLGNASGKAVQAAKKTMKVGPGAIEDHPLETRRKVVYAIKLAALQAK